MVVFTFLLSAFCFPLVRRGRARGIGVTLVTQRSAVLNKDVLTQIEVDGDGVRASGTLFIGEMSRRGA